MKIILHIGTEKTGTTSIQQFLLINKNLLIKNGVVPASELFLKNVSNNFELVLASNPDPGDLQRFRDSEFSLFRKNIKSRIAQLFAASAKTEKKTIMFSSEHMSSCLIDVSHIEALKQLFPASCKFKIIVYLRRQDELFLGTQAEGILRGYNNLKFVDPIQRADSSLYGRRYYDYDVMLSAWVEVFGESNILVRPYERSQLRGGDILEDFYSLISCDRSFARYKAIPRANKRLSAQALYVISKLNQLGISKPSMIEKKISPLDDFGLSVLVPKDVLMNFFNRFEVSNRRLAEKYLGQRELFTEKAKTYDYFDPEDDDQVLEAVTRFLSKSLF